jgi:hypothetical protein
VNECKPLDVGEAGFVDFLIDSGATSALISPQLREMLGRGLHSFPFPLFLSLLCPFPLNLS